MTGVNTAGTAGSEPGLVPGGTVRWWPLELASEARDVSSFMLGPSRTVNICTLACTFVRSETRVLLLHHCLVHRDDRNTDEKV